MSFLDEVSLMKLFPSPMVIDEKKFRYISGWNEKSLVDGVKVLFISLSKVNFCNIRVEHSTEQ